MAKKSVLVILICAWQSTLIAQLDLTKIEIGVNAGTFIYQGDLTPSPLGSYRTMKPTFGIYVNKLMTSALSFRTNLAFGKLKGDDAKYSNPEYRQQRNFNFTSSVIEISELAVWNPLGRNEERIRKFSPYIFGGIGFSFLKIRRDWSNFNTDYFSAESDVAAGLATDIQHSLPRIIPVLPVGIGVSYPISQKFSLTAETSYRFMFTDYLDGFSKAANPSRKDHYSSHTIGLMYHFGKRNNLDCPPVPK